MSSATSTDKVRLKPDATTGSRTVRRPADRGPIGAADREADTGLQPWQFFVLAALGCATAVTFVARGQGPTAIILLSVLMGAAALIGYATLRMVRPLVAAEEDRTVMIGERTRAALEREKLLTLRSIKELEFDRAMGRLSEEDFSEMGGRLRVRAARLIKQLDAGVGYRDQIEKDLAKRLGPEQDARLKGSRSDGDPGSVSDPRSASLPGERSANVSADQSASLSADQSASLSADRSASLSADRSASLSGERICASCETENDHDARFCKNCGAKL